MPDPNQPSRRHFLSTASGTVLAAVAGVGAGPATNLAPPDKQPPKLNVPKPPGKKLGYAIVGLGQLSLSQILPAFGKAQHSRPVALVSGHPDKAKQVAEAYGIDSKNIYGYDNYDAIKDNKEIDIVFIVLPNSMHAEYTIRALKAGKHVLCEKPMAANVKECEQMIAAAKEANKQLMIAYRLHYEPYNQAIIEMSRQKKFGALQFIESSNHQNVRAPNIRLSKELAGGSLGDVGVYCINAFRYITGEEPIEATGMKLQPKDDPRFAEVPAGYVFTLRFPSGVLAHGSCGFNTEGGRRYRAYCSDGWMQLDPAFDYNGIRMQTCQKGAITETKMPLKDHFAAEMDHFAECILDNKPCQTPGEEGLADMRIVTAIQESAETGKTVKL